jgi:hypothetical protein
MNRQDATTAFRGAPRYEATAPHEHPARNAVGRLAAWAAAPVLGSRLLFPRIFDGAAAALLDGDVSSAVAPEAAAHFFGQALHFDVDPHRLTRRVGDYVRIGDRVRWMGGAFLDGADWGNVIAPLASSPVHAEMIEFVSAGGDLKDTRAYRNLMRAAARGAPSLRHGIRLATSAQVDAYLGYCAALIESARRHGIVRQSAASLFHPMRRKHRDARSVVLDTAERDIGVAIAEDGALVRHLGGKHRTAIAQALALPALPVEVRLVHAGWLGRVMRETGLPAHAALAQGVRHIALQAGAGRAVSRRG